MGLRELEDVFAAVVDQTPGERAVTLAGVDDTLRLEVEALLAHGKADDLVPGIVARAAAARTKRPTMAGRRFGPYRLVREIGEGGMGAVYLATRDDEQYQNDVAIKILRRGIHSEQAIARFRDERQILATLDHPNIVRLLDGGTADGLPYLVMEHVAGETITRYAAAQHLTVRERVELFRKVCAGVQFAHGKLVVHRDLKPSNILVTADGTPKLLDFGIAKLLEVGETGPRREAETRTGMLMLTPEYASPEQARGEPVSIASDVYSLGAVLYELVAGVPAHRFEGTSVHALLQLLETTPVRPSAAAPPERRRALEGDLDNVILKALDRDPQRRYASADHLAEDLSRHLNALPVEARAPTWSYRAGKFVRRNRLAVAAAIAATLALAGGTVVSIYQAGLANESARDAEAQTRVAEAASRRAERRFAEVRALANTLVFDVDDQIATLSGATTARELIVSRALEYLDRLEAEASGDGELSRDLAAAYVKIGDIQGSPLSPNLGRPADAHRSYDRALALADRAAAGGDHSAEAQLARAGAILGLSYVDVAHAKDDTATALQIVNALPDSVPTLRLRTKVLAARYDEMPPGDPEIADVATACETAANAWSRLDPASTDARYWTGVAQNLRAEALGVAGADPAGALAWTERAQATFDELMRAHPESELYSHQVALMLTRVGMYHASFAEGLLWLPADGDLAAAETAVRAAIALEAVAADRDRRDVRAQTSLASSLAQLGWIVPRERLALWERSRDLLAKLPAETAHQEQFLVLVWFPACSLPNALAAAGRANEARAAIDQARAVSLSAAAVDPFAEVQCEYLFAGAHHTLGDDAAAIAGYGKAEARLRALLADNPANVITRIGLVETLQHTAELVPARRCALLADAATVWAAWPRPATAFTQRLGKALAAARDACR